MGKQFASIAKASDALDVSTSTISRCLKSKLIHRTAQGYIDVPDGVQLLKRPRQAAPVSDTAQIEATGDIRRLPFDMTQVEQVNALIGVLEAELRRRELEVRRRDEELRAAFGVINKLVDRLPLPSADP